MASRIISIRKRNTQNMIEEFAELMQVKNYFPVDKMGSNCIDFSFYEKREPWFFYDVYESIEDGFDYYIYINVYMEYDEFWQLLINASYKGFDICLPDDNSISPYVYELIQNGQVSQVLEVELENDEVFKVRQESGLEKFNKEKENERMFINYKYREYFLNIFKYFGLFVYMANSSQKIQLNFR